MRKPDETAAKDKEKSGSVDTPKSDEKKDDKKVASADTTAAAAPTDVAPDPAGGPIGKVRNGDRIIIDMAKRQLDLDVPNEELARRSAPGNIDPVPANGYLGIYRRDVQSMASGAVLTDLDA